MIRRSGSWARSGTRSTWWTAAGCALLYRASIADRGGLQIDLFGSDQGVGLATLDRLLAAMPTQIRRGDGIRDSHLGEIERVVDALRLLRDPGEASLADFASDVDMWSAASKVEALLSADRTRFLAASLPPAPIAGSGAARVVQLRE